MEGEVVRISRANIRIKIRMTGEISIPPKRQKDRMGAKRLGHGKSPITRRRGCSG
jgi:hypothetical protein